MTLTLKKLMAATLAAVLGTGGAAASAPVPERGGAESRHGVLMSYKEDSFRDMAAMRYDRSPFYLSLGSPEGVTVATVPAPWFGQRIVLGLDTSTEPKGNFTITVNGRQFGPTAYGRCQWEITDLIDADGKLEVDLSDLADRKHHLYAYATPKRVYVGSYTLQTGLVPAATDHGKPSGDMKLEITLGGISKPQKDIALEYMLFDGSRHQVAAGRADASPRLSFKALIPNIKPWTTDSPERYMLAIILRDDRTGAHIQTVGTPIRFADLQSKAGGMATLSGRQLLPKVAIVEPLPAQRSARELLAAQLHAGGANTVATTWSDPEWDDICEAQGLLANDFTEAMAEGILVDGSARQWGYLVRGFSPVLVELADTLSLAIDVTNRLDYNSLDDYRLDWELIDLRGVTLNSGKNITISAKPGETSRLTLATTPMPPSHDEALLNLNWRRAVDGVRIADQQMEIASTGTLPPAVPRFQRLKASKGMYTAKNTVIKPLANGRLDLLDLAGWEVDVTAIGSEKLHGNIQPSYDKQKRTLSVGGLTYGIDQDGTLVIDSRGMEITMKIPADIAERILYMGRGPGHSPAGEPVNKARIGLNRTSGALEFDETGTPLAHSDTRYLVFSTGTGTPVMRIDSETVFEFSATSTGGDLQLRIMPSSTGLIRIIPLRR